MPRVRVLLASDYRLSRTGLRQILSSSAEFEVVCEAETPTQVAEAHQRLTPDVILLEITVPGPHGLRAAAKLVEDLPGARVVVISSNENISYVRSMLAAGVLGYVLRKATDIELLLALRNAARGGRFIDPRLSDSVADVLLGNISSVRRSRQNRLSSREFQVLRGIARGFTSHELAEQLHLSTKTVETYRSRIYDKLELKTRADLVHYAIAVGLLGGDESLP